MARNYKYLDIITVFFITILLISNIVSTKITNIWLFTFDAGTLMFPLSYIFGDILTEVYGYQKAKRTIWLGFGSAFLLSICIILVWYLPADPNRWLQNAYTQILWLTPRLVIASLIAYFTGQFSNSIILAKMKIFTNWKHLRARTIWSTIIGEFIDSLIFVTIAFSFIYTNDLIIKIIISNYIFKLWVEVIFTPLTYRIISFLKKHENEDIYDSKTNFNPFI